MKNLQNKLGVWALNALLLIGLFPVTATTTGCTNQATISALVTTLGNAAAAIASIEGNASLAQKLQVDTAAAAQAVLNWKSGTSAQNIVQLLTIVQDDLYLFPISSQYVALINLAIGTVNSIILIVNSGNPAPQPQSDVARAPRRSVVLAKTPKNAEQLKKQWNAIVAEHPELARAAIQ